MEFVKPLDGTSPPLVLTLAQIPKKPEGTLAVAVRGTNENGPLRFADTINFQKASSRKKLCDQLAQITGGSFADAVLMQAYSELLSTQKAAPDREEFTIILRKMTEQDAQGSSLIVPPDADAEEISASFRRAIDELAVFSPNMVLIWPKSCADKLIVVDVDYHHFTTPPDASYIEALAEAVRPRPLAWWRSHGGGLHLVYVPVPPYAADELAACAALSIFQSDPTATVELLTSTRHPRSPRT